MRYIQYIGPAHVRQITAAEWRSVGIDGQTVMWAGFNGFAVPAEQLTDDQIRKAIDPDPFFVITGEEDDAPRPIFNDRITGETAQNPTVEVLDTPDGPSVSTDDTDGAKGDVDDRTPTSTTGGKP